MRAAGVLICLLGGACLAGRAAMPPAVRVDGVTLFPLRYIAEWFGASVAYQAASRRITLRVGLRVVRLTLDQPVAAIDGRPVTLSQPATLRDGITYVPVRFVGEALGARVDTLANPDEDGDDLVTVRAPDSGDVLLLRVAGARAEPIPAPSATALRLLDAATRGDTAAVRALLAADPSLANARDTNGETPLYRASLAGHQDCVASLLAHRADATIATLERRTPLHAAAAGGWRAILALLIAHGARFNAKDLLGVTPLHLAARAGHAELARTLLDYGAFVDARDIFGQTPLCEAARGGDAPTATRLLDAGATVDARDIDLYTPLHRAAGHGKAAMVDLLLSRGANPAATAKGGGTPRTLAQDKGFPEVVELLRKAGG